MADDISRKKAKHSKGKFTQDYPTERKDYTPIGPKRWERDPAEGGSDTVDQAIRKSSEIASQRHKKAA